VLRRRTLEAGWQFSARRWLTPPASYGYSKLEWLPARVPGHVHLDLVENGVLADPFANLHELGARWVDEEDWSYRTEFEFEPDAERSQARLCFHGLDTVCRVELNGERIAEHDNMFLPLEVDVSGRLRAGTNRLEIHFESALRVGTERRARYFVAEGLSPDLVRFDERAFVRKPQYMFGWDWGPRLISAGLCGKVELVQYRARILDVRVSQRHALDGSVELEFQSEIDGPGRVLHYLDGASTSIADGDRILIERPELWWPAGMGGQRLYRVTSVLVGESPETSLQNVLACALDQRETRVGLRRIRLLREADDYGESFEFEVNGARLWALGANWIPDSSFPARISRAQVFAQVERARSLNMNMLRIWGGGLYESEDFYDACDELGLLVWQDFPYACSYYPDDEAACAVAREEARVQVKRLRHRASLALYCGNNENLVMFQDKWDDPARHPPRYYGEHLYNDVLPAVVAELDPERAYIESSPCGGRRANDGGCGDQHYWDVWHGRGDWKYYADSTARFSSEFGFAAAPGPKATARFAPGAARPLELPLRDARARWHDKTNKGYETFIGYVELHYPRADSLEEWLYYSQLNQRDALRFGIEHYRRSAACRGTLIWQLNDCWPVQSWAVIDSEMALKAAAYELRRLYAPALLAVERAGGELRFFAVLDNAGSAISGELEVELRSLSEGRSLQRIQQSIALSPGERRWVLSVDTSAFPARSTLVSARFAGSETYRLLCEPKELELATPRLRVTVAGDELVLESDQPVLDLFLWDEAGDVEFEQNFITLPAAGTRRIAFKGAIVRLRARSLQGAHELDFRL
jgi:beta-mannosidase